MEPNVDTEERSANPSPPSTEGSSPLTPLVPYSGKDNDDQLSAIRKAYSSQSKIRLERGCLKRFKIVQVANLTPLATQEHISVLFEYLGKIEALQIYQFGEGGSLNTLPCKIGFIKFENYSSARLAQHLSNTVYKDRVIFVIPYFGSEIPTENEARILLLSGAIHSGIEEPKLPDHVISHLEGPPNLQFAVTVDPHLAERGLPPYPMLPTSSISVNSQRKIEEIRRTVVVCNLNPTTTSAGVISFFSTAGEVKYFRFCKRDNDPLIYALIEFTKQPSILEALQLNGRVLDGNVLKVYHSTQSIIKPQYKTMEIIQQEIEDALINDRSLDILHSLYITLSPSNNERLRKTCSRSRSSSSDLSNYRSSRKRDRRRSRSTSRGRHIRRRRSGSRTSRRRSRREYRYSKRSRSRSLVRRDGRRSRSSSVKRSSSRTYCSYSPKSSRSRSRSRKRERKDRSRSGRVGRRDGSYDTSRSRNKSEDRTKTDSNFSQTSGTSNPTDEEKTESKRTSLKRKKQRKQTRSRSRSPPKKRKNFSRKETEKNRLKENESSSVNRSTNPKSDSESSSDDNALKNESKTE